MNKPSALPLRGRQVLHYGEFNVLGASFFKVIEGWISMDIFMMKGGEHHLRGWGFLITSGFFGTQSLELLDYFFQWVK